MSSAEFTEWMAYYQLEPFGQERDNWHAAVIASTMANVMRTKGRGVDVDDFMLKTKPARKQTPQSIYQAFRAWAVANGASAPGSSAPGTA